MIEMLIVNVIWSVLLYCAYQEIRELRQSVRMWKRRCYKENGMDKLEWTSYRKGRKNE